MSVSMEDDLNASVVCSPRASIDLESKDQHESGHRAVQAEHRIRALRVLSALRASIDDTKQAKEERLKIIVKTAQKG
jgi:hypothetical protein